MINDVKKYSLKSVKQYIEKNEQYDLSHMICEVTGIAERDMKGLTKVKEKMIKM